MDIRGVLGITNLRSRLSGGKIILEIRILVNPRISVSEGHQLGELVSKALLGSFSDIGDVIVHIDPETHSHDALAIDHQPLLPDRHELLENIKLRWQDLLHEDDIESMDLHYLEHGIEVGLVLNKDEISAELAAQLKQAISDYEYIASLRVYSKLYETSLEKRLS
jgi:hypothetical protein